MIFGQQRVPLATPNHLDDVPAGTTEEALELLDDLAISTNRTIKALQVCIHNKGEVVEPVVCSKLQSSATLDLIQLSISKESPNVLARGVFEATTLEVAVELRLIDRIYGAKAHRNCGELPEIWHKSWVWIARQTALVSRLFLTETIHVIW